MKFLSEATLPEQPRFIQPKPVISFGSYSAAREERRAAYDELWTATDELQSLRDNANARGRAMQEAYKARAKAVFDATGEDPSKMSREERAAILKAMPGTGIADIETAMDQAYRKRLKDIEARHPDKADIIRADVPIAEDAYAIARRAESRFAAAQERADASGLSGPAKFGASLGGGFRAFLRDPVQVGTLALGAGPSTARTIGGKILQTILTEAVVNGGVEAVVQAASHEWKQKAGLDASLGTALQQIGLAAAFGGGFGGLIEGGRAAFAALRKPIPEPVLQAAASGEEAAIRTIAEAIGRPVSEAESTVLARAVEADAMDRAAFGGDLDGPDAARQAQAAVAAIEDDGPLPPLKRPKPKPMPKTQAERVLDTVAPAGPRVRQPVHLNRFLANSGGVRDYGGELRSLDAQRLFVPGSGRLMRETGMGLDRAREMAAENGYFNERYGSAEEAVAQSTVADLLDAIDRDMRGNRVYSGFDADAVEAADIAAERQARRAQARAAIEQIIAETDGNLPDAIIVRAAELHFDGDDYGDALERAIIEDYNRELPDVALDRDDGTEFEIPFFPDSERVPGERGQAAQDGQGGTGAARGADAPGGSSGLSGQGENPQDAITPDTLAPTEPLEPGTTEAADLAALALTEARKETETGLPKVPYGGWILVNKNTSEAVLETSDAAKVKALNTEKYAAVPVRDYLAEFNRRTAEGQRGPMPWSTSFQSTEKTDAGLQVLIPGVGEVTIKEKLDAQAAKPLRGGNLAPGGMFDDTKTKQIDLMDLFPAGTNVDGSPRMISHADMVADADRDSLFSDLIASCKD